MRVRLYMIGGGKPAIALTAFGFLELAQAGYRVCSKKDWIAAFCMCSK